MNPKKLLRDFLEVFNTTRRNGHTTALVRGEAASQGIVIVADLNQKEQFKRDHPHIFTCALSQMESLVASRNPIIIDLYAVANLVLGAIRVIEHTETELAKTQGDRDIFERKFAEERESKDRISKRAEAIRCELVARERELAEARKEIAELKNGFDKDGYTAAELCCGKIKQDLIAQRDMLAEALEQILTEEIARDRADAFCGHVAQMALAAVKPKQEETEP